MRQTDEFLQNRTVWIYGRAEDNQSGDISLYRCVLRRVHLKNIRRQPYLRPNKPSKPGTRPLAD